MKNLRRLSIAVAFTCALAVPAFAGEIQTTLVPPTASAHITQGQIDTPVAGQEEDTATATNSARQVALDILQSVLSLF